MCERESTPELPYFNLDYEKLKDQSGMGVVPAVIVESQSLEILMVGFMNKEAFEISRASRKATFWKRTEARLWQKGESSGVYLEIDNWQKDCDSDTLRVMVRTNGNVCHTGKPTCFD
jgi:phosphoribosyl-ATP pyrophosphohydrolase/phosphoribosyl-AMP cyclohydrolase